MSNFPTRYNHGILSELLTGHARGVWIGDSYSVPTPMDRLPGAWSRTGQMKGNRLAALWMPTKGNGTATYFKMTDHTGGTGAYVDAEASLNNWAIGSGEFSAVPIFYMGTIFGHASVTLGATISGSDSKAITYELNQDLFDAGNTGRLVEEGEYLNTRFCFFAAGPVADNSTDPALFDEAGTKLADVNLRTQSRAFWQDGGNPDLNVATATNGQDINAFYLDEALPAGSTKLELALNTAFIGSNRYCCPCGVVYYRPGERGYYHTPISDVSWSYSGLALDLATDGTGDKNYSNEQIGRWLDVTTLDRDQTVYIILHIADENLTKAQIKTHVDNIRTRWQSIAAGIGITDIRFLWVGGYMHFQTTSLTLEENRTIIETNNEALYEDATEHSSNTAFVSLYEYTDGNCFMLDDPADALGNGAVPVGTNLAARNWLQANGYHQFHFGTSTYNLVDGLYQGVLTYDGLHISTDGADDAIAGSVMADIMRRAITEDDDTAINFFGGSTMANLVLTATPTISTSAYAAGDAVGTLMTFTGAGLQGNTRKQLKRVVVTDLAKANMPIHILLFMTNPSNTTVTDNAALDVSDVDILTSLGVVAITAYTQNADNSIGYADVDIPIFLTSSGLYAIAKSEAPGAVVYSGTTDLQFNFVFADA